MKRATLTRWGFIIGVFIGLPLVVTAEENTGASSSMAKETKGQHAQAGQVTKALLYQPPRGLGAPSAGRRVGGGTRGTNKSVPILSVLAPDHTGLTVREQPDLYWFASDVVTNPVELTLTLEKGDTPLLEKRLPAPTKAGIQRVRLSDYGVKLISGERYSWSITLVLDPKRRSKDIIAVGTIERVERTDMNSAALTAAPTTEAFYRFAADGLWYDAVMTISELIESTPTNIALRKQRVELLDQVDLPEVGSFDLTIQDGKAG
ncbi:MAG TPA: DUF928 domain-containing protein [Nitrospiraceae bacterium]|nr:DUF928 domain-containing protein [Nitrospiraceae bacterium]